jgi:hypothetical protein
MVASSKASTKPTTGTVFLVDEWHEAINKVKNMIDRYCFIFILLR